jgi:hypothetical protein
VVGDTGEDVSQVAFRVDAVEIGCAEKRIDGSGPSISMVLSSR